MRNEQDFLSGAVFGTIFGTMMMVFMAMTGCFWCIGVAKNDSVTIITCQKRIEYFESRIGEIRKGYEKTLPIVSE